MIHSSCKGCPNRYVGCRRSCPSWAEYIEKKKAYDKAKNEAKRARQDATSYALSTILRNKKRRKYNAV